MHLIEVCPTSKKCKYLVHGQYNNNLKMDLSKKSINQLKAIAKAALNLAEDLEKEKPTYKLALANGCYDKGYNTTANGYISAYGGTAIVEMANGKKWKCVGHGSTGDAYYAYDGYIEFIPLF